MEIEVEVETTCPHCEAVHVDTVTVDVEPSELRGDYD